MTTFERFMSKVEMTNECWLWLGRKDRAGYGRFDLSRSKEIGAHRFAYQELVAPLEPGLFICHRCDNPGCVNPDHLWQGTPQDNVTDMIQKGRERFPGRRVSHALTTGRYQALNVPRAQKSHRTIESTLQCRNGHRYSSTNLEIAAWGKRQVIYRCRECGDLQQVPR